MRASLWQELRRRRVFRTAGMYVVGAWLIIQVADIFFPAWGLPETGIRFLFVAATALFPVALVFGWLYDVTPHGIVRTEPAGSTGAVDLRLKRVDYAILLALFGIGTAILLGSLGKIREEVEATPDASTRIETMANSIAILPFSNLDSSPDTGFFSDGITEEILHRLSTLGALHVLASTSSFAFRNSEEGPAAIIRKLGVRYLLQGSVRRDGEQVRITARLIDEDGFQVWSDTFDRRLERIFVIQAEIASRVASQIVHEIIPPTALPEGRTTANMEAYNAYLIGKANFDARTPGWKERAAAEFDRAIELDPEFAPPYAGKAMLVVNTSRGEHWVEARELAEKSLELDPELPAGLAILGLTLSVLGEHERALEALQEAIRLDPSLGIAYQWIGLPLNALGRQDEARAMRDRALDFDPLNPVALRNAAADASDFGDFERAEHLLLRLTGLPDPPGWTPRLLHQLYVDWGRYGDAIRIARDAVRSSVHGDEAMGIGLLMLGYACLGLTEDADYWFEKFRMVAESDEPPIDATYWMATLGAGHRWMSADLARVGELLSSGGDLDLPYLLSYGGFAQIQVGNLEEGVDWLTRGIVLYEQDMAPDDPPDRIDYALISQNWPNDIVIEIAFLMAYASQQTGRDQEAREATRFLTDNYASVPSPASPVLLEQMASTRLLDGDTEAALGYLREAAGLGWANYYGLINNPIWSHAPRDGELRDLLREAKARVDRQRAVIEAADRESDLRAEIESLLSVKTATP